MEFVLILTIFILAIFIGFEIISKVPPLLHTPLMSGSNAISGITIVGALLPTSFSFTHEVAKFPLIGNYSLTHLLGLIAVILATINVVCGFLVTHRMLNKFKKNN